MANCKKCNDTHEQLVMQDRIILGLKEEINVLNKSLSDTHATLLSVDKKVQQLIDLVKVKQNIVNLYGDPFNFFGDQ